MDATYIRVTSLFSRFDRLNAGGLLDSHLVYGIHEWFAETFSGLKKICSI